MTETKDKIIIQSEIDNFYRYSLLFGFVFFGWLCYLTRRAIFEEPIELIFLIIFLVFAVFGLWSLIGFWSYYATIRIYIDRLEIENFGKFFKKTIYFTG